MSAFVNLERADWLDWRSKGIGASDVAAILGISPWASPWSVWADKVGLTPPQPETDAMEFGRWAELMIGPWFTARTGLAVAGEQAQCEHPEAPWKRCTVDGFVVPDAEDASLDDALGLLQIKTTGPGPRWDELPAHYQAQEQWEMHVTGLGKAWLPVLHGRSLQVYELERDDQDIAFIAERVEAFWQDNVIAGVAPDIDGHAATLRAIAAIYPEHTPGEAVAIDHVAGTLDMLREAKAEAKAAEEKKDAATAVLRWAVGAAEEGTVGGKRAVTLRTQVRTTKCDHCGHTDESDPFRVLLPAKGFK